MIDIEKAKVAFEKYLDGFDRNNGKISTKIVHTYSVVKASKYITNDLDLSQEDKDLAELIAFLHDIGRFEQLKQFDTYVDSKSIDHGDFGADLLIKDNFIREFIVDDKYDQIIYKAIRYHNKYKIPEDLNERELLHAKLIRDADKTDNFIGFAYREPMDVMFGKPLEEVGKETISNKVYEEFMARRSILIKYKQNNMDWWVLLFAFLFDYNFNSGLKLIYDYEYINLMYERIPYSNPDTIEKMKVVKEVAISYIEDRLKEEGNNEKI